MLPVQKSLFHHCCTYLKERKGKEADLYRALKCGSHRVTCKYTTSAFPLYKHSLEGDTAANNFTHLATDILLIPHPTEGRRLSWPGWLTHSGCLTHEVVTRQSQIRRISGKVHQSETDALTTEPRHQPNS